MLPEVEIYDSAKWAKAYIQYNAVSCRTSDAGSSYVGRNGQEVVNFIDLSNLTT